MKVILRAILPLFAATFWILLGVQCLSGEVHSGSQWFMRFVLPPVFTGTALVLFVRAGLGRAGAGTQVLAAALLVMSLLYSFALSWNMV